MKRGINPHVKSDADIEPNLILLLSTRLFGRKIHCLSKELKVSLSHISAKDLYHGRMDSLCDFIEIISCFVAKCALNGLLSCLPYDSESNFLDTSSQPQVTPEPESNTSQLRCHSDSYKNNFKSRRRFPNRAAARRSDGTSESSHPITPPSNGSSAHSLDDIPLHDRAFVDSKSSRFDELCNYSPVLQIQEIPQISSSKSPPVFVPLPAMSNSPIASYNNIDRDLLSRHHKSARRSGFYQTRRTTFNSNSTQSPRTSQSNSSSCHAEHCPAGQYCTALSPISTSPTAAIKTTGRSPSTVPLDRLHDDHSRRVVDDASSMVGDHLVDLIKRRLEGLSSLSNQTSVDADVVSCQLQSLSHQLASARELATTATGSDNASARHSPIDRQLDRIATGIDLLLRHFQLTLPTTVDGVISSVTYLDQLKCLQHRLSLLYNGQIASRLQSTTLEALDYFGQVIASLQTANVDPLVD